MRADEDTPFFSAGTALAYKYDFYRFDRATGQMTWQTLAEPAPEIPGVPRVFFATAWPGTFGIVGDNRLLFDVDGASATMYDPSSGHMYTVAEQMQLHGESEGSLTDIEEILEQDVVWQYLVTLDGDRVLLIPVYEADGLQTLGDASVCVRFDCPE